MLQHIVLARRTGAVTFWSIDLCTISPRLSCGNGDMTWLFQQGAPLLGVFAASIQRAQKGVLVADDKASGEDALQRRTDTAAKTLPIHPQPADAAAITQCREAPRRVQISLPRGVVVDLRPKKNPAHCAPPLVLARNSLDRRQVVSQFQPDLHVAGNVHRYRKLVKPFMIKSKVFLHTR